MDSQVTKTPPLVVLHRRQSSASVRMRRLLNSMAANRITDRCTDTSDAIPTATMTASDSVKSRVFAPWSGTIIVTAKATTAIPAALLAIAERMLEPLRRNLRASRALWKRIASAHSSGVHWNSYALRSGAPAGDDATASIPLLWIDVRRRSKEA